jgi:hypothetical protein
MASTTLRVLRTRLAKMLIPVLMLATRDIGLELPISEASDAPPPLFKRLFIQQTQEVPRWLRFTNLVKLLEVSIYLPSISQILFLLAYSIHNLARTEFRLN